MKVDVEKLRSLLERNEYYQGYLACESMLNEAEQAFMEQLTAETATDFVAGAVLYSQFAANENKHWKAVPVMERVRGALRFVFDFVADNAMVTCLLRTVANFYANAGFFPESIEYFKKEAEAHTGDSEKADALYNAFSYSMFFYGKISQDLIDLSEKILNHHLTQQLVDVVTQQNQTKPRIDPIEREPVYLKIRYEVEKAVDEYLLTIAIMEPFQFAYWKAKKKILSERFGLTWRTPVEMNPGFRFQ